MGASDEQEARRTGGAKHVFRGVIEGKRRDQGVRNKILQVLRIHCIGRLGESKVGEAAVDVMEESRGAEFAMRVRKGRKTQTMV